MAFKDNPQVGQIFVNYRDNKFVRVDSVKAKEIHVTILDGKTLSPTSFTDDLDETDWDNYEPYKKVPPPELENQESKRFFKYDDDNQEIVILDEAGTELGRMKGLYGPNGDSFYDVWCKHHQKDPKDPLSWKIFEDSFKGKDGNSINGENGLDAYELWKMRQPQEVDTSFDAFMQSLRGPKGKDGYEGKDGKDAYEIWKETQPVGHQTRQDYINFQEGTKGENGKSAYELWLELYKPEGRATEEDFFRWLAGLASEQAPKGDTFIPSIDTDGKLYFINSRTRERSEVKHDVNGKDGKTFHPVIHDNYLWFEDEEGNVYGQKNWIKGETGEVGRTGKSAYELWLDEPGNANKSYDEFKESLRGADGVNVKAKYDFKDLEDYVCPVQKIPTHLLLGTDGLEDGRSAERILDDRADEIKQMRNDGEALSKEPWYYLKHLFKEVTWWCAGADSALLRMCPADHSKYAGIGTVILFTALMATFSSFIAMQFVLGVGSAGLLNWSQMKATPGPYLIAGIFAVFWGMMIFFLDRFITNTMYSDGKVTISWLEFRSALPRIVISILLGIVISAPLELKIFDQEIQKYLADSADGKAAEKLLLTSEYEMRHKSYEDEVKKVEALLDNYNNVVNNPNDSAYFVTDKSQVLSKTDQINSSMTDRRTGNTTYSSGGASTTYGKKRDKKLYDDAVKAADELYTEAKNNLASLEKTILDADSIQCSKISSEIKSKGNGLFDNLAALHAVAMKIEPKNPKHTINNKEGYQPLNLGWEHQLLTGVVLFFLLMSFTFKSYFGVFGDDEEEMAGKTRKWNFITNVPICLVVAIICALCYESFHWLFYYLTTAVGLIMLLFIIIDVSPVFYKMMLADGVYDKKLHEDKKIVEDKIRYNLAKTLYKMDRSELKNIAPFVFSHTYQKMTKKKSRDEFFTGPVGNNAEVSKKDAALFERVLKQKELIIKAAYDAWFRNMRDAIIGGSQPPGSGNDRTQGENFRPEDNFTQGPDSSFGNDNAKSQYEKSDDTNDGDFEETSYQSSENADNSTSEQESSYSNDENSQYESVVDDDDLNESETPKD